MFFFYYFFGFRSQVTFLFFFLEKSRFLYSLMKFKIDIPILIINTSIETNKGGKNEKIFFIQQTDKSYGRHLKITVEYLVSCQIKQIQNSSSQNFRPKKRRGRHDYSLQTQKIKHLKNR